MGKKWNCFLFNVEKIFRLITISFSFLFSLIFVGVGIYLGIELKFEGFLILFVPAALFLLVGVANVFHHIKKSDDDCEKNARRVRVV